MKYCVISKARRPAVLCCLCLPAASQAIVTLGSDIELEGFVQAKNILRTPSFDDAELIMQRNISQLEGKYYFLRDSTAFGRFDTGRLEEATLNITARGHYDSVYDIRDAYEDVRAQSAQYEVKIREAFIDFILPPFSLRLGKQ